MSAPLGVEGAVPLAVVERSGFVESVHQGAAVVVGPDGVTRAALGDVEALVYPRSALKPFQTIAAVRAGAHLDEAGLAIVTASHAGTPRHQDAVRAVLRTHGLDETALRTPEAWPLFPDVARGIAADGGGPSRIAMNCSGNHAGMLAGASASGWDIGDYLAADHPVHALAEQVIAESCGTAPSHRGTDGCGGPVWAVPLVALARGYGRLVATEPALAAAVRARADLVDGAGGATTRAIETTGAFAKSGAEGVWCAVAPDGSAAAVKVLDGSGRAAAAVAVRLLAGTGAISGTAADRYLDDPSLTLTGGGTTVGRVRVVA